MHVFVPLYSAWQLNFHKQLFSHKKGVWYQGGGVEQCIQMATEYKIVLILPPVSTVIMYVCMSNVQPLCFVCTCTVYHLFPTQRQVGRASSLH